MYKILSLTLSFFFLMPVQADSSYYFNFSEGHEGWMGEFADYPVGEEAFYELQWGWTTLPYELPDTKKGMVLSGNNHSDDLLMFIKRQITDLEPNTEYHLTFHVTIESNVASGQIGIGGSPGESVFFKVGAASHEPQKQIIDDYYRINIDVGNQSEGGANGVVIGHIANILVDANDPHYMPKELMTTAPLRATTDEKGNLWVLAGTDSGFESTSTYYIANITITAQK